MPSRLHEALIELSERGEPAGAHTVLARAVQDAKVVQLVSDLPSRAGRRRLAPRRIVVTAAAAAITVLIAVVVGTLPQSKLSRIDVGGATDGRAEVAHGAASRTVLVVGVDDAPESGSGRRADAIALVRLAPDGVRVLSVPRDLVVATKGASPVRISMLRSPTPEVPDGGPARLIEAVSGALGVPVHHYMEVDFRGFERVVDLAGGVHVRFAGPMRDVPAGFAVSAPGCVLLDGQAAVRYVRARHVETYVDGHWIPDPSGDLGRIRRQQDFAFKFLQAVRGALADDARLVPLVRAGAEHVAIDDETSIDDLIAWARQLRDIEPGRLTATVVPATVRDIGGAAVLVADPSDTHAFAERFFGEPTAPAAKARSERNCDESQ